GAGRRGHSGVARTAAGSEGARTGGGRFGQGVRGRMQAGYSGRGGLLPPRRNPAHGAPSHGGGVSRCAEARSPKYGVPSHRDPFARIRNESGVASAIGSNQVGEEKDRWTHGVPSPHERRGT